MFDGSTFAEEIPVNPLNVSATKVGRLPDTTSTLYVPSPK
jgi:hypothetical protein